MDIIDWTDPIADVLIAVFIICAFGLVALAAYWWRFRKSLFRIT